MQNLDTKLCRGLQGLLPRKVSGSKPPSVINFFGQVGGGVGPPRLVEVLVSCPEHLSC